MYPEKTKFDNSGFASYICVMKTGGVIRFKAENIYEAIERLVRVEGVHPTKIKSVGEEGEN